MRWIRLLLPLALFLLVVVFELNEHEFNANAFDVEMIGEIVFFGILGPSMVFLALSY